MQVKQLLEQNFPGMEVLGSTYPIPASRQMLGNLISVVQMAALIMIFAGPQIFAAMGHPQPPAWYQQLAGNKASAGIAVWFVGNMLHNSVMSSGAFEIYFNGQLMHSKLDTGRLPTLEELLSRLRSSIEAASAAASEAAVN